MLRTALLALALLAPSIACSSARTEHDDPRARDSRVDANVAASVERGQRWDAPPIERVVVARDGRGGGSIELADLFDRLASADVVFLGETHLDETTHRFQLAVYEALLERRGGRVVLALEMFERDVQPALDQYLAGAIDEPTFLARARPWSNYRTAYRPLIERARLAGAPVIASNFPAALRARVASEGAAAIAALPDDQREHAPAELLPNTPAYWRRVDNAIRGHAGMMGAAPAADDPRLTSVQSLWDNSMGDSCARALERHPGALVLHVNGGFHTEYWDGTARQLALRKPDARVLTVAIDPSSSPTTDDVGGVARADFVVAAHARAQDVDQGTHAVYVSRELKYRLHVPQSASARSPAPLLIWLGRDGSSAREELAEWKERLGDVCAIAAIDAPHRETQQDLVEGARWFWSDSFSEDVAAVRARVAEAWGYVLRHHPIDASRVCLAGEGAGATVVAATALYDQAIGAKAVAWIPERFAKIKDFPLPLPELLGDAPRPAKSLRVIADAADRPWWSAELEQYRAIGFPSELQAATVDPWAIDLERENAVRAALGLSTREAPPNAARRFALAEGARARAWGRRIASRRLASDGELVAVLERAPDDAGATELPLSVRAGDFIADRKLPRSPGAFGGTTVVVLPSDVPDAERDAWLALEADDPLAKQSRFHRLRVATASGERALPAVLADLREKNRNNVLIVPARFCADAATLRELQGLAREFEARMTISWQPGLGNPGSD